MPLVTDDELRNLLQRVQSIAVVGIKVGEQEDAHRVPRYMQAHGYRIIPVNPKLAKVLGERAFPSLGAAQQPIDLVNLFRASRHLPVHAQEILQLTPLPKAVWLQLGIRHDDVAAQLEAAGVAVVQDRCLMVDHQRLLGREPVRPAGSPS